ncbi:unnamed protein product [Pieris macdunnoughi]|uniref:Uncharacterized protein n=1 Tax=Pieris macdunnoughi TaxID=345717 RepID=A0A821W466_9NEOP|nr:unnamed protein product [Pieris macdunnoughi]
MQKKIVVLTLIYYWVEATPLNADSVDFTAISNLKYDSKDLVDYLNYLEDEQSNNNAKKKSSKKGSKVNYNIEDLKKFFKSLGFKDDGSYDDSETYSLTEEIPREFD